jgi:hypothetical protein
MSAKSLPQQNSSLLNIRTNNEENQENGDEPLNTGRSNSSREDRGPTTERALLTPNA